MADSDDITHDESARKPSAMWSEDDGEYVIGYMCLTDFECEIGAACGGNTIYPSVEDCKRNRRCVDHCGIVKVKVEAVEIVQPPAPIEDWD